MRKPVKLCPVCLTENTGGRPHRYHKLAARKSGHTLQELTIAARATIEQNAVIAILMDAVDEARHPDYWRSRPRTEYHRAYYWRKVEARRESTRETKRQARMTKRLRPLIADLCRAVDLGRISARW